jgi:cell division protein YceG involved in septum cleavage
MTFYKLYWASGRFSIKSKVKFVLRTLLIQILLGIIVLGVVGAFLIKTYGKGILESGQTTVLILSNVYGMILLVSLLAHGLIKMPIFFWKYSDNTYNLINSL